MAGGDRFAGRVRPGSGSVPRSARRVRPGSDSVPRLGAGAGRIDAVAREKSGWGLDFGSEWHQRGGSDPVSGCDRAPRYGVARDFRRVRGSAEGVAGESRDDGGAPQRVGGDRGRVDARRSGSAPRLGAQAGGSGGSWAADRPPDITGPARGSPSESARRSILGVDLRGRPAQYGHAAPRPPLTPALTRRVRHAIASGARMRCESPRRSAWAFPTDTSVTRGR